MNLIKNIVEKKLMMLIIKRKKKDFDLLIKNKDKLVFNIMKNIKDFVDIDNLNIYELEIINFLNYNDYEKNFEEFCKVEK